MDGSRRSFVSCKFLVIIYDIGKKYKEIGEIHPLKQGIFEMKTATSFRGHDSLFSKVETSLLPLSKQKKRSIKLASDLFAGQSGFRGKQVAQDRFKRLEDTSFGNHTKRHASLRDWMRE